jgi:aspartyl/asparaginyl-tRNA synthetase
MSIDLITPADFDFVSTKLREFFKKKGLVEVAAQHRLSILAACENPFNISTFEYVGKVWPLPQTSQMWLEYELLTKPDVPGYFSFATSYRAEPDAIPGRHNLIFPMIEFEIHGDFNDLTNFEKELLEHLGYGKKDSFPEGDYLDLCKKYNTNELTHEHEQQLYKDYGPVFFLKNFPESTSPFWNMLRDEKTGLAKKCDVIMSGIETIGSAERSCDAKAMNDKFHTISDGDYAKTLFSRFGKDRVLGELDEFSKHKFTKRVGAGIGVTRLIRSLKIN